MDIINLYGLLLRLLIEILIDMNKILVVGQTPPPYGGQAMMIKYLVDYAYSDTKVYHVRMSFSRDFHDRGKFSLYKIIHIFNIIWQIWKSRFRYNVRTLYYPVSSEPKVALLRDVIILAFTRFLFCKIVYHFHAAGISEELPKYPNGLRQICYQVLKYPDIAITSSKYNPKDGEYLQAKKIEIIPLGIPDSNKEEQRQSYGQNPYLTVLFMGLLNETKGEGYVLDAIKELNLTDRDVRFIVTGRFESEEYERFFIKAVNEYGLGSKVDYRGVVTGEDKQKAFMDADVFCFPSFFSSESFGIVVLEAMMYQMPIIASRWRGLQSVVDEGENGFLVDIKNSKQITDCLIKLYDNRFLLSRMAIKSREMFKEQFMIERYLQSIEKTLTND